jgi:hypothetical protein
MFKSGHLSEVIGLKLEDGREVVVKIRPYAHRLTACFEVQKHLFRAGFPCPEPILGPQALGGLCATVERLVVGGTPSPITPREPLPFARPLARLIALATPLAPHLDLEPKPSWNRWDHTEDGIWPVAEDSERPLNDVVGPEWLDHAGSVARECLEAGSGPLVVGHGDWYQENLRFSGEDLFVAHDWDSMIMDREAIIVGFAAADYIAPSIEESAQFLRVYQEVSNRQFTADEIRECWAAGLWLRSFNAKKQLAKEEQLLALTPIDAARLEEFVLA